MAETDGFALVTCMITLLLVAGFLYVVPKKTQ